MTVPVQHSTHRPWLNGVVRTLPVVLGYVAIGFAFGVLSQKAGLAWFNTLALSIVVYAGAAQLIAVGLFVAGNDRFYPHIQRIQRRRTSSRR